MEAPVNADREWRMQALRGCHTYLAGGLNMLSPGLRANDYSPLVAAFPAEGGWATSLFCVPFDFAQGRLFFVSLPPQG
jgi:hypothetical protein